MCLPFAFDVVKISCQLYSCEPGYHSWWQYCLLGEFCFDEDVFVGGKGSKSSSKSQSEKTKDRLSYARVQKTPTGNLEFDISKQEPHKLQDEDSFI